VERTSRRTPRWARKNHGGNRAGEKTKTKKTPDEKKKTKKKRGGHKITKIPITTKKKKNSQKGGIWGRPLAFFTPRAEEKQNKKKCIKNTVKKEKNIRESRPGVQSAYKSPKKRT